MVALPTLFPTSDITDGGWLNENLIDATNLFQAINESGSGDTVYIYGLLNGATSVGRWGLTDTPSGFSEMNSIDIEIRHSRGGSEGGDSGGGDDTHTLFARIVDSSNTALTNEMTIETGTIGYLVKTETVSFTGVVAGTKAAWDGARLELRTTFSKTKGNDGDRIHVDFARIINGDYSAFTQVLKVEGETVEVSEADLKFVVVAPLTLRPIADDAAGSWTSTPLWSKVDEVTPSDSDTISSDIVDSGSSPTTEAELRLTSSLAATPSSIGAILGIRAKANLTGGANDPLMRVTLENRAASSTVQLMLTNVTTSFVTYYLPLSPELMDTNVVDWEDLRIILQGLIDGAFGTIQIEVSWVEIEVVDPAVEPNSFSDLTLPHYGFAGPIDTGGFIWALGVVNNELWLVKAASPSDGHNPGDWSFVVMVDRSKDTLDSAYMVLDGGDLHIAIKNEISQWFTSIPLRFLVRLIRYDVGGSVIDLYGGINSTTVETGQPDAVNVDGRSGLWMGRRSDGSYEVATTYPEQIRTFDVPYIWHFSSAGNDEGAAVMGTTGSHQLLGTAVMSNNRVHTFMVHDTDDDGPNRQQTMRANDTLQSYPGSSWASVDLVGWGFGVGYGSSLVIAVFRRGTTGIRAALFTSADSPSLSEETVTTRDASGAGYFTSVAVIALDGVPWVFWLDDAATDAIYSASRPSTAWVGEVQQQAGGGNSWDTLYAGVVNTDSAGILVAANTGDIFYFEFPIGTAEKWRQPRVVQGLVSSDRRGS